MDSGIQYCDFKGGMMTFDGKFDCCPLGDPDFIMLYDAF